MSLFTLSLKVVLTCRRNTLSLSVKSTRSAFAMIGSLKTFLNIYVRGSNKSGNFLRC